jgi:predicted nucleic acid-binding protein
MPEYVIADTSVLIIFDKIDRFEILKEVYQKIYTTPEIADEFNKPVPDWIIVESVKDKRYQKFIQTQVDIGEASAIALATEKEDSLLIIDDLKARKLARRLGIKFTGTLGVINKAKASGLIDEIKPLLEKLRESNFRISDTIIESLLKRNNE